MKSDVLDIIFENRNKAYGAYYLRKFYTNRLLKSLGLMMTGVIVLSAFTFMPASKNKKNGNIEVAGIIEMKEIDKKPKDPEKPKEPVQPKKNSAATVQYTSDIKIVPASTVIPPVDAITDTAQIANVTGGGAPGEAPIVGTTPGGDGDGGGKSKDLVVEPAVDIITPTASPDVMPEFPGGMKALQRFLQKNLTNPREMDENEKVSVKVRFVVGYDGKLKSFEVAEDGGEEFNKEVIRVLKKMPEWTPGKTRGQSVSVYYTIPVKFVPAE